MGCFDSECADLDPACSAQGLLAASILPDNAFVAVTTTNVFFSSDGLNWTGPIATGASGNLNDITYGNNVYVAVGANGAIVYSRDRVTWFTAVSGTVNILNGVAFGNGRFVATGQTGTVLVSFDGQNWSPQSVGAAVNLNRVRFGSGLFVVVQAGAATNYFSQSGFTGSWQSSSRVSSVFGYAATFDNGRWLFAETAASIEVFSADVTTSQFNSATAISSCNGHAHFAGSRFYCVGDNSNFSYSSVAAETPWAGGVLGCQTGAAGEFVRGIAFGSGRFVSAGDDLANNGAICVSSSGLPGTFTAVTVAATALPFSNLAYLQGPLRLRYR